MTLINKIIDTEKEAEEIVKKAEEDARTIVGKGEDISETSILEKKEGLKEDRAKQMASQREALKKIYKDILEEGGRVSQNVEEKAKQKKSQAVSAILKELSY